MNKGEYRVEMHRLVLVRRAAGKPPWARVVRLGDIWRVDMPFEQLRNEVVRRLRQSGWLDDTEQFVDLTDTLDELAETEDVKEFDAVWAAIYSYADIDRVFIDTVSPV